MSDTVFNSLPRVPLINYIGTILVLITVRMLMGCTSLVNGLQK